jgi:VWFA-related protein
VQPPTTSPRQVTAAIDRLKVMSIVDAGPEVRQRRMLEGIVATQVSMAGEATTTTVGAEVGDAGAGGGRGVAPGGNQDLGDRPCEPQLGDLARAYARATYDDLHRTLEALGTFTDSLAGLPGKKGLLYLSDGLPLVPGQEAFELLLQMCGGGAAGAGVAGAVADAALLGPEALNVQALQLEAASFSAEKLFRRLTERANANRVTFFTLEATGPRPPSSSLAETESRYLTFQSVDAMQQANFQDSLHVMASETGGQAVLNAGDLGSALESVAADLDSFYSLGYRVAGGPGERARRLEVKVRRPGVEVRYRRSLQPKLPAQHLADLTLGSLLFGVEDNPLAVALEVGEPLALDGTLFSVPIRLSIPIGKLTLVSQGGSHVGRLSIQVGARDRQGKLAPVRAAAIPISIPDAHLAEARGKLFLYEVKMLMRAGDHAVAVGLRDEIGAVASLLRAEVPVAAR